MELPTGSVIVETLPMPYDSTMPRSDASRRTRALATAADAFEHLEERTPSLRRELALAEIGSSMRLAGHRFARDEVAALAERGIAPQGRSLAACNALADYAAASDYVAHVSRTGRRRAWLEAREIVALHTLATRRTLGARPGLWRAETHAPRGDGAVAPAPWAIPREIDRYVERVAPGPPAAPEALATWLAEALRGFDRIAPFSSANGRVGRLVLGILLRRLRLPPLVLESAAQTARFRTACDLATRGELEPLALALASALVRTVENARLATAGSPLVPLASLADPAERPALYKAVERGRLRAIRRGRNVYSSAAWLAEYRRSLSPAGRPRTSPLAAGKCDPGRAANNAL